MTRAMLLLAMFFLSGILGRDVWAMTGVQLLEICSQDSKEACENYVAGVRDGAQQMDVQGRPSGLFIMSPLAWCYPKEQQVTSNLEVRTILAWMRDHPERLRETAARVIGNALADNFKCGGDGGGDRGDEEGDPLFDFDFGNGIQ